MAPFFWHSERAARPSVRRASQKTDIERMHGQVARPKLQAAVGVGRPWRLDSGKSLYSMTCTLPSIDTTLPTRSKRVAFVDHLRRHFAAGQAVAAQEQLIANLQQRIVDLAIEKVLNAAPLGIGQAAAFDQSREHSAVAVGSQEQRAGRFEQNPLESVIDGPHRRLAENADVLRGRPNHRCSSRYCRVMSSVAGLVIT